MKNTLIGLWSILFLNTGYAQEVLIGQSHGSYEPPIGICITEEQRADIERNIQESRRALKADGLLLENTKGGDVLYEFPISYSPSFEWNNGYAISNFKDHDNSTGILDYQCGNRTYDGHQGTDYFNWPFQHYLMDNDQVWAVAAAPGTIIYKTDGQYDQECAWSSGLAWNAVYVEHADGSISWYGHLKQGSLTIKEIGQSVETGEYLGVLGSSGYSSAPHLHFEKHNATGLVLDPYSGECNGNASGSSWVNQAPYAEMEVNAILTHDAAPEFGCPSANEHPHLSNQFMPGQLVYYAAYYKDHQAGVNTHYTIYRPDGSVFNTWDHASPANYNASWWYWTYTLPFNAPEGTWTFTAETGAELYTHEFQVGDSSVSVLESTMSHVRIFPNPAEDVVMISFSEGIGLTKIQLALFDLSGREIEINEHISWRGNICQLEVIDLKKGLYFIQIKDEERIVLKKWMKN